MMQRFSQNHYRAAALFAAIGLSGAAEAQFKFASSESEDFDPFESVNRVIFTFNEKLDEHILRPVALGYRNMMPQLLDSGITNVFNNLGDVGVLANSMLQLKADKSAVTMSRLMFNTTFGVVGFFDVATDFGLPREDEDFGQTLGYWGVNAGPYLMLPLFGPSTLRDAAGRVPDTLLDPSYYFLEGGESLVASGTEVVDKRADLIPAESFIIGDRYQFIRSAYLQRREYLVKDGQVDDPFASDDFDEDFEY